MHTITTFLLLPATATKFEHQTSATPNALQHQPDLVYLQCRYLTGTKWRLLGWSKITSHWMPNAGYGMYPCQTLYRVVLALVQDPILRHNNPSLKDSPTPSSPCPESDHDDYFEFQAHSEDARASFADFQWPASDAEDSSGSRSQSPVCFSDSDDDSFFGALAVNDGAANDSSDDEAASTDGAPNDEFYVDDIASDPLFRTRASIFDAENTVEEEDSIPLAFDDHPTIRHAYIRAFVGSTFKGMTRDAVSNMLEGSYTLLRSAAASGADFPGLSNFARTLPTVEKRLGVLTDEIIIYLFLCNACWKPHYPQELSKLKTPHCDQPDCSGTLYTKAIARMCMQPGKVAQWQEWRGPDDAPGQREPSKLTGYAAFDDLDKPMTDITDGWGWRAIQAGLERRRNSLWEIRDVDVDNLKQQFVAMPNGLVIQINLDWFQAVKGPCHSTGALYATVCNNPRGIRFLREETSLLVIFPGLSEPMQEQYNNIMDIVVEHFKKLPTHRADPDSLSRRSFRCSRQR
ncbi:hypothetical protein MVEN_00061600 [Mycena venus]|uniref:Uncharacterized protein n=1 Tax=Mycena venus TaxID=2733690 RepID=A0A8H6Z3Q2_9AGAR|nr:hypothetical protein MVEN_00061600 [Mycena venus]